MGQGHMAVSFLCSSADLTDIALLEAKSELVVLHVQALATCAEMRPPVDISVGGDDSEEGVGVGGARTEYRSAVAA